jgi:hypothetical protein
VCHTPLLDANFYAFLYRIDQDLAATTQADGCLRCGNRLHKDRFRRKPRGGPAGIDPFRLSFTCSQCDKRHTPPSVRWLGRKVYLAAIVVLASALRAGLSDHRAARLAEYINVPKRTIERWRRWWLQDFADSAFWKQARSRLMPPIVVVALPASLLERFAGSDLSGQLVAVLQFLTPLSKGS